MPTADRHRQMIKHMCHLNAAMWKDRLHDTNLLSAQPLPINICYGVVRSKSLPSEWFQKFRQPQNLLALEEC